MCFISVLNELRGDLFQFMNILCIDFGIAMLMSSNGIPCFAKCIDLRSGAHDADIADLVGFKMWRLFCDVGLETSSITNAGISSVAAKCFVIARIMFWILDACGD